VPFEEIEIKINLDFLHVPIIGEGNPSSRKKSDAKASGSSPKLD
jgi:hypothetical protein